MIKGLLLYCQDDAQKNTWFIEHLINIAKKYNIDLNLYVSDDQTDEKSIPTDGIDFCINRTRFPCINSTLESKNIRCYNNHDSVKIFNDKWYTYLLCTDIGIPVMETVKLGSSDGIPFEFPFVIKSRNGHGGSEVFMVNNAVELKKFNFSNKSGYIAQRLVSDPGTDVRIYVLGDTPVAAVKRSSDCDFRSNFSLGGRVEIFTPSEDQLSVIRKLRQVIPTDYAGFDFISHNGKWILNEVEDVVGARMLYSLCDYDIAENLISYIRKDLESRGL